jgi:hypothetical protein
MRATDYEETIERLTRDDVVTGMAATMPDHPTPDMWHQTGHATFSFMQQANRVYAARGGDMSKQRHIGAVAEAIAELKGWT